MENILHGLYQHPSVHLICLDIGKLSSNLGVHTPPLSFLNGLIPLQAVVPSPRTSPRTSETTPTWRTRPPPRASSPPRCDPSSPRRVAREPRSWPRPPRLLIRHLPIERRRGRGRSGMCAARQRAMMSRRTFVFLRTVVRWRASSRRRLSRRDEMASG